MHTIALQGDWVRAVWLSPFPYQMFGTIVGFIVVFRCGRSSHLRICLADFA